MSDVVPADAKVFIGNFCDTTMKRSYFPGRKLSVM